VNDLWAKLRQAFRRFGGPPSSSVHVGVDVDVDTTHDTTVDHRLDSLEYRQKEIAARLRLLEMAGDPRGIRDE
jgi:hypothetical protein